jgi:hypothetical protein
MVKFPRKKGRKIDSRKHTFLIVNRVSAEFFFKRVNRVSPVDNSDVTTAKRQELVLQDLPRVRAFVHQVELGQDADGSQPCRKSLTLALEEEAGVQC